MFFIISIFASFSVFAESDPEIIESRKCSAMFTYFEKKYNLPENTLHSISLQETQKSHSKYNIGLVWPWTVNSKGRGYHFNNRDEAIEFAQAEIKAGNKSIDIGCMQINLKYHPDAFDSIEQAFSPRQNIAYGAKFLKDNYSQAGSWKEAIGHYHSYQKNKAANYHAKVNRFKQNMTIYKERLKKLIYA